MKRSLALAHAAEHGGYGASGAGFAGANLILARLLPQTEYALFTLFVALVNLGYALAPAGVDGSSTGGTWSRAAAVSAR